MRLLLDEQYSHRIAARLRDQGFDAVAVAESDPLTGLDDDALLAFATGERRALLTNNVRHFTPLARERALAGEDHYGLVFTSDKALPRHRDTIGRYVDLLQDLLTANPAEDALVNQVRWLRG